MGKAKVKLKKILETAKKGYIKATSETLSYPKVEIKAKEVKAQIPYYYPIQEVEEEKKKEEAKKIVGIEIPEFSRAFFGMKEEEKIEEEKISLTYNLIPKTGERIFAYAKVYFDEKSKRYVYEVVEPELNERQKELLEKIKYLIETRLEVGLTKLTKEEAENFLRNTFEEVCKLYKIKLSSDEKEIFFYYIKRDYLGLGKIEPLMQDENIEDISCDGYSIPIFVFHRNPKIGSISTNVVFESSEELDSFVIKLAQVCGKSISILNPFLNGTLPDGSRVQATLGTDIARRGSNFTIRKFSEKPLTPTHLLSYNTLDLKVLAYLWIAVEYGQSILVSGGTGSGKTTLLNILSMFIRQDKKIVSIEDTAELKLLHEHWVPHVARTAIATREGEVDLFALLKESLRQRPDYIIVGEVRGPEAYVLFQQMATGHPSLATIHAEDINKLIDRLTTPPINLPASLIQSLNVVVFISQTKYRGRLVRRVTEVYEIVGFDREKGIPIVNLVFKWDPINDKFVSVNKSVVLKRISERWGIREVDLISEVNRRMLVLDWIRKRNVLDYKDFYKVLTAYYLYPDKLIEIIKESS